MELITSIIQKLKIKELFSMLFIISKQEDSNFYKLEMNCLSVYTSCIHD